MDIQEILGKLTEEQKRELLEAAKLEVVESKSESQEAIENKPTKFWTKVYKSRFDLTYSYYKLI